MIMRTFRIDRDQRYSWIKNQRSLFVSRTRPCSPRRLKTIKHRVLSFKQRLTGKIDATTNVDSNSDLRAAFPRFALESQHASGRSASQDCRTEEGHACSDRARLAVGYETVDRSNTRYADA